MRTALLALALLSPLAAHAEKGAEKGGQNPAHTIDITDPQTCAACHKQIVSEWSESMHSMAHHDRDPLYAGMRALRMKKQGPQLAARCAQCHNPVAPEAPDSPAGLAGVSCAACHNLSGVKGGTHGAASLIRDPEPTLRGPHDVAPGKAKVHGTGPAAPWITDGRSLCLTCHGEHTNGKGVPVCTTGAEVADGARCVDCHMPTVESPGGAFGGPTHRSHIFAGPHRAWLQDDVTLLSQSVSISGEIRQGAEGPEVVAEIRNVTAHDLPTGFPGRVIVFRLTGLDAQGQIVWRNDGGTPFGVPPEALLNKVYVDAKGQPTMPPFSVALKADRRLKPGASRTLRHPLPSAVQTVKVQAIFHLAPPPMFALLKMTDAPEATPKIMATATLQRQF